MNVPQGYIDRFGPVAGPKIFRIEKSRAAYKGVSTRRRRRIEAMTGIPFRIRTPRPFRQMTLFPAEPVAADGKA